MGIETLIGVLGFLGTLLLVVVGLLNFSVFRKQLRIAKDQIDTAVRQLEIAQKQPDLLLIQRAVAQTSDHLRYFVEHQNYDPTFTMGPSGVPAMRSRQMRSKRWQN